MDLIERYLQAVEFWLPKQQKRDIIAELSEDIRAQVEERESELGRALDETEVEALLRQRGAPVVVANRYLPQQHLIGPLMFPIYRFVLTIVALCYLVPWLLVWIGLKIFGPIDPAGAGTHSWIDSFGSLWGSFWITTFVTLGIVTLVFAVLERVQAKTRFLDNWNPRKLPPVRDRNRIPRADSSIELAVNFVFYTWWAWNMSSPFVWERAGIRVALSPVWSWFYWGFLVLALANAALAAFNLMRPFKTRLRGTLRLLNDLAGGALFCWLLKSSIFTLLTVTSGSPAKTLDFTNAMNWWMAKLYPWGILACAVVLAVDIFRIARMDARNVALASTTSAATLP